MQVGASVPANLAAGSGVAACPAGTQVIGGGGGSQNTTLRVYSSRPNGNAGWLATFIRDQVTASSATFQVYAICAVVS